MLKQLMVGMTAMLAMTAASAASAADWWLLSRAPAGEHALFADADAMEREPGGSVSLRVMRIDREGRVSERIERVHCGDPDRLSRFACATPDDRDTHGLILAGMAPAEAARMLFDMEPVQAEPRGRDF